MDTRDWLKEQLDNLTESKYAEVWNGYCHSNNYYDQLLHPMEELNDIFNDKTPLEIADIAVNARAFNVNDNWVVVKESYHGTEIQSDDDPRYLTEEDELLDYIEEHAEDYDFLDDNDYREKVSEGMEDAEWESFEEWFEDEYGCNMFEFDIEVLLDEWEASKEEEE